MAQSVQLLNDRPLTKLNDSKLMLDDDRLDIRGRKVVDAAGKTIGHVRALFVDAADRKVRMLDIAGGGFLGIDDQHFLLPVDAITKVTDSLVTVNESSERIAGSPAYNPTLVSDYDRSYWEPYYGYYGRAPYWDMSYRYPDYPTWF